MDGPSTALRSNILDMIVKAADADDDHAEDELEETLDRIRRDLAAEARATRLGYLDQAAALDELAAVDAWAALISSAVARVYAPVGFWPRPIAGWSNRIAERLRDLTGLLQSRLKAIAAAVGASSYSISISFPWGVSVGLDWPA